MDSGPLQTEYLDTIHQESNIILLEGYDTTHRLFENLPYIRTTFSST